MNKLTITVATLAGLLAVSGPTFAKHERGHKHERYDRDVYEPRYSRVDKRQKRQKRRIADGIESGELTRWEAKKLKKQQRRIARTERRMLRDGYLDKHERRHLEEMQDRAHRRIKRFKHNEHTRYKRYSDGHHWGDHRDHDYRSGWRYDFGDHDDKLSLWFW